MISADGRKKQWITALVWYAENELTITEIAKMCNVTRQYIHWLYKKYGIAYYKRPAKRYIKQPKALGMSLERMNKSGIHSKFIVDRYNEGYSAAEISRMTDRKLSINAIYNRLCKAGVKCRKDTRQKMTDEQIIDGINAGLSMAKIAKQYNVTWSAVHRRVQGLKKKGLIKLA